MDVETKVSVVIDGMNVALANVPSYERDPVVRKQKAVEGLQLALDYFLELNVDLKIFAPQSFVEDHELVALRRAGLLFVTPGGLDDQFMLGHADEHGSFIVSNDQFRDHVRDRGYMADWLDFHRVPFMFDPKFVPATDALDRMRAVSNGKAPPPVARRTVHKAPEVLPPTVQLLRVPRCAVGRIIGKRGANIRALELDYGVKIRIDRDAPPDEPAVVRVASPDPTKRANAVAAIDDIAQRARRLDFPDAPPPRRHDDDTRPREEERPVFVVDAMDIDDE